MATQKTTPGRDKSRTGFDITMETVVGHVRYDNLSDLTPAGAAMLTIAEIMSGLDPDQKSTFRFPGDGGIFTVTTEWQRDMSQPMEVTDPRD